MIYRAPQWLRNIVDFEFSTGEDIKGVPSKRRQKKINKKKKIAKQKRDIKEWDRNWEKMMSTHTEQIRFREFYKAVYRSGGYISTYDLEYRIKNQLRGNMDVWKGFRKYKREKNEDEAKQRRIKRDLDNLYDKILKDFYQNPYYFDKVKTTNTAYGMKIQYRMEDGTTVEMFGSDIEYNNLRQTITYTLSTLMRLKFVQLFNRIVSDLNSKGKHRSSKQSRSNQSRYRYTSGGNGGPGTGYDKTTKKNANHPKRDLYDTLLNTITQRKEQLDSLSKNDPNRTSLQNELNTAKSKAQKIKKKYGF